jgi:hypothetical protein
MRRIVAALVLGAVVFAASPAQAKKKPKATTTTVKKPSGYKVGQTAQTGDFKVTVHGFTDPYVPTESFFAAKPGNHYVTVDVEIMNPTKSQQLFSSLAGFHLADAKNKEYNETIIVGLDPPAPEGQIPAGGAVRGNAGFEIPDGSPGPLRLRVQGNLTASGAYFVLA